MLLQATWERSFCWEPPRKQREVTKATFLMLASFLAGVELNFAAQATSNSSRVAGMSTIPTATGARGRESICAKTRKRSEEHTSELQSRLHLVCRLLLEKKK